MADKTFLDWPFFEDRHRDLAASVDAWAAASLGHVDHADTDAACRALVRGMGDAGILTHSAVDPFGGALDVRSLCLIRETLARHDGLADFAFAMQGLGTGAISLFGTEAQKAELAALAAKPDSEIDYSDSPPLTEAFFKNAMQGRFYRPTKTSTTVRIDSDVLAWLRSQGKGYQSRINAILRREMLASIK